MDKCVKSIRKIYIIKVERSEFVKIRWFGLVNDSVGRAQKSDPWKTLESII